MGRIFTPCDCSLRCLRDDGGGGGSGRILYVLVVHLVVYMITRVYRIFFTLSEIKES